MMIEKEFVSSYDLNMKINIIGMFVVEAGRFRSAVQICYREKTADAKSVLGILSLEIAEGSPFTMRVDGEDQEEAMAALGKLLQAPPANK